MKRANDTLKYIESTIDGITSLGFKNMDADIQEYILDTMKKAKLAFKVNDFDKTKKLLKDCNFVCRFRNFRKESVEATA